MVDRYDAGLLNDFGGGNVEWWQDYLRAELERAHDFYADQIEAAERLAGARVKAINDYLQDSLGGIHASDYIRTLAEGIVALAEPAGEAEPILDQDKVDGWPSAKLALWKVVTDENMNDGHYINAYRFTEKLYEAVTTPPASAIREALEKIVAAADTEPFTSIGHVIEHMVPDARAALARRTREEV